jgi:hypothetical protein
MFAAALMALSFAVPALAATDLYFTNKPIVFTEQVYDLNAHFLTLSYGHNLSNGQTMCAGAHEYASFSCQGSVSTHPYEGTHNIRAAIFSLAEGTVHADGHGDY